MILSDRTTLIRSYLYLTSVGLISGGIGRRGPESGCAPGGGAGGRGGSALMVALLSFLLSFFFSYFWQGSHGCIVVMFLSLCYHFFISYFWQGSNVCIVFIFSVQMVSLIPASIYALISQIKVVLSRVA